MLTGPLFMLQIYDRVLGSRSEETLVALFGLVAVLYLFYGLLEFARGRVMARVAARVQETLNARLFLSVVERRARSPGAPGRSPALQDLEFYEAILLPDMDALAAMPDLEMLPGMPVEAFLRTRDRSPLSYLTQPLTIYFNRAFREG